MSAAPDIDFSQFITPSNDVPKTLVAKAGLPHLRVRIPEFLSKLHAIEGRDIDAIKAICDEEVQVLKSCYFPIYSMNTIIKWLTHNYRGAIQEYQKEVAPRDHLDPKTGDHFALLYARPTNEEIEVAHASTKDKSSKQSKEMIPFPVLNYIERIDSSLRQAIKSLSGNEIAACLCAAVGARLSESLLTGQVVKRLSKHQFTFQGKLKRGGKGLAKQFTRITLVDSSLIEDGLYALRNLSDWEDRLGADATVASVKSRFQTEVDKAAVDLFSDVLPPLKNYDKESGKTNALKISPRSFRRAFVASAVALFKRENHGTIDFVRGLANWDSADSASGYEKYYCVDEQGNKIHEAYWLDRLESPAATPQYSKTQKQRIHIPAIVLSAIDSGRFGVATRDKGQAWITLLETADRVQAIEAENAALRAEIEALKAQNQRLQSAPQHPSTPAVQAKTTAADLPSAQLFGEKLMKTPGTAAARIERAIEAIRAFNSGLAVVDKIAITPTVIQRVTGSRIGTIRELLGGGQNPDGSDRPLTDLGRAMVDYNQYNAFGYHQNRGKDLDAVAEFVKSYA